MVSDHTSPTNSPVVPDRFRLAVECVSAIRESAARSGRSLNHLEDTVLNRADAQLRKLSDSRRENELNQSCARSHGDELFCDRFLDFFSTEAFSEDLDALRQAEGSSMTEADFSTLADSIKSFGYGMTPSDRKVLEAYLDSKS